MASYKEIQAQIAHLQRQAVKQRECELTAAVQKIHHLMQEYDISFEDLQSVRKKGTFKKFAEKKSAPVLFRNAETGKTWSGRGRMPYWLSKQNKERFRV
jgi:DNA-binding protein H-NS